MFVIIVVPGCAHHHLQSSIMIDKNCA